MLIGYARVSTQDQDLTAQIDALTKKGCEEIFEDKVSGMKSSRPGLDEALTYMRAGDTFVVWKLDRLGRSLRHLLELVAELKERGIEFVSLTDSIDTTTPMGRFFFHMMSALAELERDLIRERTKAGLDAARARGRVGGRPPKLTEDQIDAARTLVEGGQGVSEVAKLFGVHGSTLYRGLNSD